MPEGEGGKVVGNLTEDRLEALAEWWSLSKAEKIAHKLPDPASVAAILGVSASLVRKAQHDKRLMALVRERLDRELLYTVVEIRPVLRQMALDPEHRDCLKAGRTIEELAGNLKSGPRLINTVNNVMPSTFETMTDADFASMAEDYLRDRGDKDSGAS